MIMANDTIGISAQAWKPVDVFEFSISFDGKQNSYDVESIIDQLKTWQSKFWGDRVSYIVLDEHFSVLGFRICYKKLSAFITWSRRAGNFARNLGLTFDSEKIKYQKDLFSYF